MRKGKFLACFGLVLACFLYTGCGGVKYLWCTSDGVLTYNRHTGQFELIWDVKTQQNEVHNDTAYVQQHLVEFNDSVR